MLDLNQDCLCLFSTKINWKFYWFLLIFSYHVFPTKIRVSIFEKYLFYLVIESNLFGWEYFLIFLVVFPFAYEPQRVWERRNSRVTYHHPSIGTTTHHRFRRQQPPLISPHKLLVVPPPSEKDCGATEESNCCCTTTAVILVVRLPHSLQGDGLGLRFCLHGCSRWRKLGTKRPLLRCPLLVRCSPTRILLEAAKRRWRVGMCRYCHGENGVLHPSFWRGTAPGFVSLWLPH